MHHSFVRAYSRDPLDGISSEKAPQSTTPRVSTLEVNVGARDQPSPNTFVVAIDFGTTFSAVAFTVLRPGDRRDMVEIDEIAYISNYPDSPGGVRGSKLEAPTESCYDIKTKRTLEPKNNSTNDNNDNNDDNDDNDNDGDHAQGGDSLIDQMDIDTNENTDQNDTDPDFLWGYCVYQHFRHPDADRTKFKRISRSKLLLYRSEHTKNLRNQLKNTVRQLQDIGAIRSGMDFIVDYLARLLTHTKQQLVQYHKFKETDSVEFVITVPAMWKRWACRRMQNALREANCRSEFVRETSGSVEHIHIVSEPEAAAARVLTSQRDIQPGDTFMILDAGGGTVDAITYKLKDTEPLRMEREAVRPKGVLCGSSYLNEHYEQLLRERLEGETYLNIDTGDPTKSISIDGIIDSLVIDFENQDKRNVDITDGNFSGQDVFVFGLRPNKDKNFVYNRMRLSREDLRRIFLPCLKGISDLMVSQLELARGHNLTVKTVLLIGGFSASPSLHNYLKGVLEKRSKDTGELLVELLCQDVPETAVASGAILSALNREQGPARIIQSSYGFMRNEPWQPDTIEAHQQSNPKLADRNDGDRYVKNTIYWVIKKGDEVPSFSEYSLTTFFTFPARPNQKFICEEVLYVSDRYQESHYKKGHSKNKGAKAVGKIVVDMTFLRTEGHIQPIKPDNPYGRLHYCVEYELVMIVDGLNIKYEARWNDGQEIHVLARKKISIAAAFASLEVDGESGSDENDDFSD